MSVSEESTPSSVTVRLGHSGGLVNPVARAVSAAIAFGLVCVITGGVGLLNSHGGWIKLLAWVLSSAGLLVVAAGGALLLLGRWPGRSTELSARGIRLSTWRGTRTIVWSRIQRCEIRTADNGRHRLLAAWEAREGGGDGAGSRLLWLGDVSRGPIPDHEVMALVQQWMDT